jgi:hypothetical protein
LKGACMRRKSSAFIYSLPRINHKRAAFLGAR